jgi:hypothetical protein
MEQRYAILEHVYHVVHFPLPSSTNQNFYDLSTVFSNSTPPCSYCVSSWRARVLARRSKFMTEDYLARMLQEAERSLPGS